MHARPTTLFVGSITRISIVAIALAGLAFATGAEETPPPPAETEASADDAASRFDVLVGRWVRPDGGYTLTIGGVRADGQLEATYANPRPLPFSKADASLDGDVLRVFLELTAGGYAGSTYTLTWDPERDVLEGVYYQAVAQQSYDIFFERSE